MKYRSLFRNIKVPKELVLLALAGTLTAVNLIVVGMPFNPTAALMTDSQGVPSNQFTTGTFDVKLSDSNETDQDSVTATWTSTGMRPGDSVSATLSVKNIGTVVGDHIEISTSNTMTEAASAPGSTSTVPMDSVLEIIVFSYDGVDKRSLISDSNGNGFKDMDDLEATTIDNLALTDLNLAHTLEMTVLLNYNVSANQHHGDSVATVFTVTLNQDSSQ